MKGDCANAQVLVGVSAWDSGLNTSLPIDRIFDDQSSPAGKAVMLNCTGVAGPNPNNVGWLNIPNVSNKQSNAMPDRQLVLNALKQLRALRIEPPMNRPAGVTDVKFLRGWIQGGSGRTGLTIKADTSSPKAAAVKNSSDR